MALWILRGIAATCHLAIAVVTGILVYFTYISPKFGLGEWTTDDIVCAVWIVGVCIAALFATVLFLLPRTARAALYAHRFVGLLFLLVTGYVSATEIHRRGWTYFVEMGYPSLIGVLAAVLLAGTALDFGVQRRSRRPARAV